MTPNFKSIFILGLLFLSGCGTVSTIRGIVADQGADAADQALETSLWTLCNGSPVGAINRRFRDESERAAYRTICPGNVLPEGGEVEDLSDSVNVQ